MIMKQPLPLKSSATLLLALALALTTNTRAQEMTKFTAVPGKSKVKIDGTSTIHDWVVESQLVGGAIELDSTFPVDPAQNPAAPGKVKAKVDVTIPVRQLKSGKKPMDEVMYQAMNQTTFPKIEYHLTEMALKEVPATVGAPLQFDTKGELTVSGVTNQITMPVTLERIDKTKLRFTGAIALKMTSYGIKPPSPKGTFGLISTGDDVKITFEWLTAVPAKPAAAAP